MGTRRTCGQPKAHCEGSWSPRPSPLLHCETCARPPAVFYLASVLAAAPEVTGAFPDFAGGDRPPANHLAG